MNYRQPKQRKDDGKWQFTCTNGAAPWPEGYCATNDCRHETAEEAAACYRRWLVEQKSGEAFGQLDVQRKCVLCGYWYLLTTAQDVATLEEIPESWGWMDTSSGKLVIRKGAPVLCPELYTPEFLASLLRNYFAGKVHEREVDQLVRESVEKASASKDHDWERALADLRRELQSLKDQVRTFEEASGVSVSAPWRGTGWGDARRVGEAVAKLLSLGEDAERYAREAYDRRRLAQVADRARVRLMDVVSDLESLGREVVKTEEVT